jgi:hypothetical protein
MGHYDIPWRRVEKMTADRFVATVAAALVAALPYAATNAQFSNFVNLPQGDFTWRWGDWEKSGSRRSEDFSVSGGEGRFRCDLTGRLSPGNPMTSPEIRQMERDLSATLHFIQAAANAMNVLDRQRDLDWAELACVQPQPAEGDAQEQQEKVDRAREKALREMLERRERRERRENQ